VGRWLLHTPSLRAILARSGAHSLLRAVVTAGYGMGWVLGVVIWIEELVFIKLKIERGCR